MAKICLCLTAKTIEKNLEILNKYRKYADLVELRVDCLNSDERLYIRRFPELAGLPAILTIRRDIDGGFYRGGEGARVKLFANGLAYANADSRFNFAYVDIEDDLDVPSLEEAARTFGTRIIRSFHKMDGTIEDIPAKLKSMQKSGDEIVKLAVAVKNTADVLRVYQASKAFADREKILICMGEFGVYSRILAEKFGSFLNFATALSENDLQKTAGQLDIKELAELYRFRKITKKTQIFGLIGYPIKASVSPWFFNTIFGLENTDAVYVPFPTNSVNDIFSIIEELDVQGLSVTVPYKEEILKMIPNYSSAVQSIGACNTVYRYNNNWYGENTDVTGFSDSILTFLNKKNLKNIKATIIGAGGAARAVASEIYRLGGKALILNRTVHKAKEIAAQYGFRWGGIDTPGIELINKFSNVIIQTTSVGMEGYDLSDPLELYTFTGKETVMDLIYKPEETLFLKRAMAAGCKIINGYDMVIRQACLQYALFTRTEIPKPLLSRISPSGDMSWNKMRTS
jgi:3-dehydroquinate dehydratase/shikimate dehydrogenase